jgi:hypothetical protein
MKSETIIGWRSVCLCVASPLKNLSQGPSFGGCGFIYALFRSKLCLVMRKNGKILNGRLRARKNIGAKHNF